MSAHEVVLQMTRGTISQIQRLSISPADRISKLRIFMREIQKEIDSVTVAAAELTPTFTPGAPTAPDPTVTQGDPPDEDDPPLPRPSPMMP